LGGRREDEVFERESLAEMVGPTSPRIKGKKRVVLTATTNKERERKKKTDRQYVRKNRLRGYEKAEIKPSNDSGFDWTSGIEGIKTTTGA